MCQAESLGKPNTLITSSDSSADPCEAPKLPSDCLPTGENAVKDKGIQRNGCDPNKKRTTVCSRRLADLCFADQKDLDDYERTFPDGDRHGSMTPALKQKTMIRIAEIKKIAQSGCFKTAADYDAAALVFLHSENAEDYLQAAKWASKALELGDQCHKRYVGFGFGRYLIETNHKLADGCPCYNKPAGLSADLERGFLENFGCLMKDPKIRSSSGETCLTKACQ